MKCPLMNAECHGLKFKADMKFCSILNKYLSDMNSSECHAIYNGFYDWQCPNCGGVIKQGNICNYCGYKKEI